MSEQTADGRVRSTGKIPDRVDLVVVSPANRTVAALSRIDILDPPDCAREERARCVQLAQQSPKSIRVFGK
jgi:hypothetical protein